MENKKMLILTAIVAAFIGLIIIVSVTNKTQNIFENCDSNECEIDYESDKPIVAMHIEKYGDIMIELYPDIAPNTVNNFIYLIKGGFYDNNTFHRLIPGYVLQGGDPSGVGDGNPGYAIKGEMTNNGFTNDLKHTEGIVSMARRSSSYDTAGSQFFIMLGTAEYLDGEYAAFGKVIKGMNVIKKIEQNEKVGDEATGKLESNLDITMTIVDLNGYKYKEPDIIMN